MMKTMLGGGDATAFGRASPAGTGVEQAARKMARRLAQSARMLTPNSPAKALLYSLYETGYTVLNKGARRGDRPAGFERVRSGPAACKEGRGSRE